jgi:hypothetical protein
MNIARKQITMEEFVEFLRLYFITESNQRLGQAFYNQFDSSGAPFPELFYTTDNDLANELIIKHYIKE